MKTKQIISLALFSLLSLCSVAQDSTLSISGRIHYGNISYFNKESGKINGRNEGLLQVEFSSKLKGNTQWKAMADVREDITDKSRNRLWLDELWIKQRIGFADVTLGKQIVGWGTADGINPVNNINPVDYNDLLDTEDEIIGVYGVRSQLFFGSADLDIVWTPVVSVGKLPETNSRWFPSLSLLGIPQEIVNMGVGIEILDQVPEISLTNSEFGARLRNRFSGFDIGLSYYNGFDHLPEFEVDTLIILPKPLLLLKGVYYRQQVVGAELAIALPSGFGFRGESALFIPESSKPASNLYIQSVVGIDRNFEFDRGSLMAIVQYVHDYRVDGPEYKTLDTRHIFRNSIAYSIDFTFNNGLALKAISMVNLKSNDYIIRPEVSYLSSKGIKFIARGDVLKGKSDTFFGIYTDNSRVQCKVEYKF